MKKPPNNKRRGSNSTNTNSTPNWFEGIYIGFSPTNKNAWLWFFITIFMVAFTGNQLANAIATESILNLRIATTVHLSERPIWFIFVTLFDFIVFLFSLGYIWYFIKQRIK